MERLNPDKLHVEFGKGVTPIEPIIPRRYTLTHSDVTAELFLNIGLNYAFDKINPMRDEVLAEWKLINCQYSFHVYCYIGGPIGRKLSDFRYKIFVRELPLALEAIRYGDRRFFSEHPFLDYVPIWIHFQSYYPEFNRVEYWGTPSDYK